MNKNARLAMVCLLTLGVLACSFTAPGASPSQPAIPLSTKEPPAATTASQAPSTQTPLPQPTQEAPSGNATAPLPEWAMASELILQDDFSQDKGLTPTVTDGSFNERFTQDGLRVEGLKENWWDFIPYKTNEDVSNTFMSVDTRLIKTDGPGDYGFVCRYKDAKNFYGFYISSVNGTFVIQKTENNVDSFLRSGISQNIPTGQPMTIQVSCTSNRLALGVNGKLLAEVFDSALSTGKVGLLVDTGEKAGIEVAFGNFKVYGGKTGPFPATPTPPAWNPNGSPIAQETFGKDEGKWTPYRVETGPLSYQNNELWVTIQKINFTHLIAYQTNLDVKDVLISVKLRMEKAAANSDVGIICRYVEGTTNHYAVTITPDGHYTIEKWENSKPTFLSYGFSDNIPAGQPMTLQASCVGNKIGIGVNGKILSEVTDDAYSSGGIGLQLWADDPNGATAAFSQFKVYKP